MTAPTPLILLSHGSRHPRAQAGIDELISGVVAELDGPETPPVVDAHLEFSPDTLSAVATRLAAGGHRRAVVAPLLFTSGYHARSDVPTELRDAAESSGIDLELAGTLGSGADIARVLARRVRRDLNVGPAGPAEPGAPDALEVSDLALYVVGSSRTEAQADYARLVDLLVAETRRRVHLVPATGPGSQRTLADLAGQVGGPLHVAALFVTEGLLLDRARAHQASRAPGTPGGTELFTLSTPLTSDLAPVVAARYRQVAAS